MAGLLEIVGALAALVAAFAGLILLAGVGPRIWPRIPGARRELRVPPLIINWPPERQHQKAMKPLGLVARETAILALVAAPGTIWWISRPDENHLDLRLMEIIGGGLVACVCLAWLEWLARLAAWHRSSGPDELRS